MYEPETKADKIKIAVTAALVCIAFFAVLNIFGALVMGGG